ncbi:MAG: hypothetical protein V4621_02740 [Pseudomonadota bacterium]
MDKDTAYITELTEREEAPLSRLIDDVRATPELCDDPFLGAVTSTPDEALGHDILTMAADDPVLASLIKQYLNSSRQHKDLLRTNGMQDAMVDVAADMVDSAWCALQTRLLELRAATSQDQTEKEPYTYVSAKPEMSAPAPVTPKDDFVAFLMWLAVMWPNVRQDRDIDPRANFSIAAAGRI